MVPSPSLMRTRSSTLGLLLAVGLALAGCSVLVDNELANKVGDAGPPDAGLTGETCTNDAQCISFDPFNCNRVCGAAGRCIDGPAPDGTRCGMGAMMHCVAQTCVIKECGDGFVDRTAVPPEFCDDGDDIDTNACNNNCTRSCVPPAPPTCDDGDPCNGMEACVMAMGVCRATMPADDGTACGTAGMCTDGACVEP